MVENSPWADREAPREMRAAAREQRPQEAAHVLEVYLDKLPPEKSAPEKVMLAALLKAATSASNGWQSDRLQNGDASRRKPVRPALPDRSRH